MAEPEFSEKVYLERIARDMATVKQMLAKVVIYMDDLHDVTFMYTQMGHEPPPHIKREMERCDDRYRQLLEEAHTDGGTFEKVRREMAKDPLNRWDHTRQITKKETP